MGGRLAGGGNQTPPKGPGRKEGALFNIRRVKKDGPGGKREESSYAPTEAREGPILGRADNENDVRTIPLYQGGM